jgi:hypothetical protein
LDEFNNSIRREVLREGNGEREREEGRETMCPHDCSRFDPRILHGCFHGGFHGCLHAVKVAAEMPFMTQKKAA